jgi:hypothetical protein
MKTTEIIRCKCPTCQQPIETDERTARSGIQCPGCGIGFIPDRFQQLEPSNFKLPEPRRSHAPGDFAGTVAIALLALALCVLAIFIGGTVLGEVRSPYSWAAAVSGLFSFSFMAGVICQLQRIRHALEKRK